MNPSARLPEDGHACTDLGNANRLIDRHGQALRYVPAWGWLVWDGRRWARDELGSVMERAKDTVRHMYGAAETALTKERRKELARWAAVSESDTRLRAMVRLAQTDPEVARRTLDFDTDPFVLNVLNGALDVRAGHLFGHDPEQGITKLAPVEYHEAATAPLWDAFLERTLPDPEVRAFVRRAVGYSLTADVGEQCLFLLHGTGANGKSVFLGAIEAVLGPDYSHTADFAAFLAGRHDGPRNDIARLAGARFVKSVEVDDGRRLAEGLVKTLTGGDRISARFLYREAFEFVPAFKLWLGANHKPEIRGTDYAIWRRIRLVPFTVTIAPPEQDPTLAEKLRAEAPGILAWAVRGCADWQRRGLAAPRAVLAATEAYREESDPLGDFLAEECELGPAARARPAQLHTEYRKWCEARGETPMPPQRFGRRLGDRGIAAAKDTSGNRWRVGIRLRGVPADTVGTADSGGLERVSADLTRTRPVYGTNGQSAVSAVEEPDEPRRAGGAG